MKRAPRNPKTDDLVNDCLTGVAYGQIGAARGMRGEGSGERLQRRGHRTNLGLEVREMFS